MWRVRSSLPRRPFCPRPSRCVPACGAVCCNAFVGYGRKVECMGVWLRVYVCMFKNVPCPCVRDPCGGVCAPVLCCPSQNFEIRVQTFFTISKAALVLPFQLEDASRPDTAFETKVGASLCCQLSTRTCGIVIVGSRARTRTHTLLLSVSLAVCL